VEFPAWKLPGGELCKDHTRPLRVAMAIGTGPILVTYMLTYTTSGPEPSPSPWLSASVGPRASLGLDPKPLGPVVVSERH
jgi:hypothetical protein